MTQGPISEAYFGLFEKIALFHLLKSDVCGSLTRLRSLNFYLLQQRPPKYLVQKTVCPMM